MSYSSVTVSGYNSSPPPDDGSSGSDNQVTWAKIKTKLSDPVKTAVESINTNVASAFTASDAAWAAGDAALDASKLNAASYTAADVLSKLLTVDGSGSGLDADLLDAKSSAAFCQVANNLSDVTAATAFGNIKQDATTSTTGVVELATAAEMVTGTDTGRVPSVSVVKNSQNAAKAWGTVNTNGTTTGNQTENVASSSNDAGTGAYSVVFTNNMSDAKYVAIANVTDATQGQITITSRSATGFSVQIKDASGSNLDAAWSFVVFGALA